MLEFPSINQDNDSLATNFINKDNEENKNVNSYKKVHSVKKFELLMDSAKLNICEIIIEIPHTTIKRNGTGFLCSIPDPEKNHKLIVVLLTCYHVLSIQKKESNFVIKNSKIDYIEILYKKSLNSLYLNNRRIWVNEEMDYACIEIKKDEYEINDEKVNKVDEENKSIDKYKGTSTEIFGISKDTTSENDIWEKLDFSDGEIIEIDEYKRIISNNCSLKGFSGGPIYNIDNNKVLGIHIGTKKDTQKNKVGLFLKEVIEDIKNNNNPLYIEN